MNYPIIIPSYGGYHGPIDGVKVLSLYISIHILMFIGGLIYSIINRSIKKVFYWEDRRTLSIFSMVLIFINGGALLFITAQFIYNLL